MVGDDRRYLWAPYADGWTFGDSMWEYGAPVSALILDDNGFAVTIRPAARAGDPAQLLLIPPFEYFPIDNCVRTEEGGERRIDFDRKSSSRQVHIWGSIPLGAPGMTQLLAVDYPALYRDKVFCHALTPRAIAAHSTTPAAHPTSVD